MVAPSESNTSSYGAERRGYGRQRVLFSSVVLNEGNCGRVLNISPNGLALQTDTELVGEDFPFRFKFSPSLAWVEAKGRVVWRNDLKNVVGIEFVGLTDEVQKQIKTWMDWKKESAESLNTNFSSGDAPLNEGTQTNEPAPMHEHSVAREIGTERSAALAAAKAEGLNLNGENHGPANQTSEFLFSSEQFGDPDPEGQMATEASPQEVLPGFEHPSLAPITTTEKEPIETQAFSRPEGMKSSSGVGTRIKIVGLALLIIFMVCVILFRRNHPQVLSKSVQSNTAVRTALPPARPNQAVSIPSTPSAKSHGVSPVSSLPSPAVPHAPPSRQNPTGHGPTFVLQVAAMLHEENANTLVTTLRDSDFPAFVMKLPTERFHHVLVGPFNSASAATETQTKLEQRGYKPIRTEWKAPSR